MFDYRPHARILVALAAMILLPLATAQAEPDPTDEVDDQALAVEFYEQASQAYGAGEFDRAAEYLGRAFDHDPDLIYRYNQILALYGLGDYETALALLDEHKEAMIDDERFDDVDDLRLELEESLAELRELEAQREQERAAEQEVQPLPQESVEESSNTLAWAMLGTGGASLAAGLFFGSGVLLSQHIDRIEASRTPEGEQEVYSGITFERQDDLDILRSHQILTATFLTAGALLGGTGAFLLWRGRSSEAGLEDGPALGLHLTPGSVLLRGTF